jgi:hypothetical protein
MLIFSIPRLIEYCSTIFDLVPGDVIATGRLLQARVHDDAAGCGGGLVALARRSAGAPNKSQQENPRSRVGAAASGSSSVYGSAMTINAAPINS